MNNQRSKSHNKSLHLVLIIPNNRGYTQDKYTRDKD